MVMHSYVTEYCHLKLKSSVLFLFMTSFLDILNSFIFGIISGDSCTIIVLFTLGQSCILPEMRRIAAVITVRSGGDGHKHLCPR